MDKLKKVNIADGAVFPVTHHERFAEIAYLSSLCQGVAHIVRTRPHRFLLLWAYLAAVPQVSPAAFRPSSSFGFPHFFFLSEVYAIAVFFGRSLVILKTCPSDFHRLLLSMMQMIEMCRGRWGISTHQGIICHK